MHARDGDAALREVDGERLADEIQRCLGGAVRVAAAPAHDRVAVRRQDRGDVDDERCGWRGRRRPAAEQALLEQLLRDEKRAELCFLGGGGICGVLGAHRLR